MDKKQIEESIIATVGDLIAHLQKSFKPTDKLCFWYEGGAYMNCENVLKSMFGDMMFKYVRDDKQERVNRGRSKKEVDADYEFVGDDDVVIY